MNENYIGVKEAAEIIGVSPLTIYNLCYKTRRGEENFPHYKANGLKFLRSEIVEWMKGKKVLSKDELLEKYGHNKFTLSLIA
jgi:predicted DNA-binding transcriptional regulator AlpA